MTANTAPSSAQFKREFSVADEHTYNRSSPLRWSSAWERLSKARGPQISGPQLHPREEFIETGWTADLARVLLLGRQALHAATLAWEDFAWESPLPMDLAAFCESGGTGPRGGSLRL